MTVIVAPQPLLFKDAYSIKVFLAGSIENGTAENWQQEVMQLLNNDKIYILNPRRSDWNKDWKQSIDNRDFKIQVDWELNGLEKADTVIFYFAGDTKSPISLMELGLISGRQKCDAIIYCHPDFWRRGNIEVMCERYNHILFTDKEEFLNYIKNNV